MYLPRNEEILAPTPPQQLDCEISTVYEQGSSAMNEDRLLLGDEVYGVFDGATSLDDKDQRYTGLTGGAMAAQIAHDTFLHGEESLFETAIEANRKIAIAAVSCGLDMKRRESLWSTSMAVVRLAGDHLEYCQTGDSLIMLLHNDGTHSLVIPEVDIDGETMKMWQQVDTESSRSIYNVLSKQLRKVRLQMNRKYGVLNGEAEALSFLRYGSLRLDSVTDVLLFTDGLFLPKEDPQQRTDWQSFAAIYRSQGLAGLQNYVRKLQNSDLSLRTYPRFKLHDDIAAISLRLSGAVT